MKVYGIFPTSVDEIPDEEFFAILYPESTTIPGDERSRTNPGYGYPEHTVRNWSIEVHATREKWEAEIVRLETNKTKYKAIRAIPAKITTTLTVNVK